MGADVTVDTDADSGAAARRGTIVARSSRLSGCEVDPAEVPGLVDEIPILAVAAAFAEGETRFRGVGELRVKESDRLATITSELSNFTGAVEAGPDELVVHGGERLVGAPAQSHGDHRIAMSMAVAALAAADASIIDGWDAVATSYPSFERDLQQLTAGGRH
jgi:3-phosphoshikimate 1-carboxyvinyltransferase